jgi:tRNA(Arg) A34 adenosine deaminase TadA
VVVTDVDLQHLRRCVELARTALKAGHGPFGAVLVAASGRNLHEDHNRATDADQTLHAGTGVIRWAVTNLAPGGAAFGGRRPGAELQDEMKALYEVRYRW